jgi:calcium/calmodulin-dependent 3',5'-cyclic nucleotide phosphodiesterase
VYDRCIYVYDRSVCMYDRRLYDEDDELNEVETETVPQEVREWLSSTFTRSTAGGKRRDSGDKVCFKSVAHAIRAGIVVDR